MARDPLAFSTQVEKDTGGQVRLKIYFGGIAGDEIQVGERIRRDQLDGTVSGGMLCMRAAPSMRVMRVLGLFQGRNELSYVLGRLKPQLDEEFRRAGFVNLGARRHRARAHLLAQARAHARRGQGDQAVGLGRRRHARPGPDGARFLTVRADVPRGGGRLYDEGKIDGFVAAPAAALAFQWSARGKYLMPLRLASLDACVIIANRAFDPLPEEYKAVIRTRRRTPSSLSRSWARARRCAARRAVRQAGAHHHPVLSGDVSREFFFEAARACATR